MKEGSRILKPNKRRLNILRIGEGTTRKWMILILFANI